MYTIKRVKQAPLGPGGQQDPATTHYVTQVAPNGNVVGWTKDVSQAGRFDEATTAKVETFYAGRSNVGVLTFDLANVEAPPIPVVEAPIPVVEAPPIPVVVEPKPQGVRRRQERVTESIGN